MTTTKSKVTDVLVHLGDLHSQALRDVRYLPLHWVSSPEAWREVLICDASWASPLHAVIPPDGLIGVFLGSPVYEDRALDRSVLELRNEQGDVLVTTKARREPL